MHFCISEIPFTKFTLNSNLPTSRAFTMRVKITETHATCSPLPRSQSQIFGLYRWVTLNSNSKNSQNYNSTLRLSLSYPAGMWLLVHPAYSETAKTARYLESTEFLIKCKNGSFHSNFDSTISGWACFKVSFVAPRALKQLTQTLRNLPCTQRVSNTLSLLTIPAEKDRQYNDNYL